MTPVTSRPLRLTLVALTALALGVGGVVLPAAAAQAVVPSGCTLDTSATPISVSCDFTASTSFTVPGGVSSITAVVNGAKGADNWNRGGAGASITARIPVTAAQVLNITVGAGGGPSYSSGAAAGGESDIRTGSAISTALVVAGGGGAGGSAGAAGAGGAAGVLTGGNSCVAGVAGTAASTNPSKGGSGTGGQGGACGAGGAGGTTGGTAGSAGVGGTGASIGNGGGGGGAGYYGGGGGGGYSGSGASNGGGGGGGSSYISGSATFVSGTANSSTASVQLSYPIALARIAISPTTTTATYPHGVTFAVEGFDSDDASLGDLTSAATFSVSDGGNCTAATCTAPVGPHTVTATIGSLHDTASLTVEKADTTTALSASPNPGVHGQGIALTAQVTPAAAGGADPSGSVDFYDGAALLGSRPLSGASATLTVTSLTTGHHQLTAVYGGDDEYNGSTSSPALGQDVAAGSTAVAVIPSATSSTYGQSVVFTATVTAVAPASGTPSGPVAFAIGASTFATVEVDASGVATATTDALPVGSAVAVTATYLGDGDFAGSTSPTLHQAVTQADTDVVLSAAPQVSSTHGQAVTLTATVSSDVTGAQRPTGTVRFFVDGALLGAQQLVPGTAPGQAKASLTTSALSTGEHALTAVYDGDDGFRSSQTATALGYATGRAAASIVLDDPSSTTSGAPLTLRAVVSSPAGTPTGTVTFSTGTASLGTSALIDGVATLTLPQAPATALAVTASYSGDVDYSPATSAAQTTAIVQPKPGSPTGAPSETALSGDTAPASVYHGADVTVQGSVEKLTVPWSGDDQWVYVWIFSHAQYIDAFPVVDGHITLEVPIGADFPIGPHRIVLKGTTSGAIEIATLTVTPASGATTPVTSAAPAPAAAGSGAALADTGSDVMPPLGAASIALLAGAALLVARSARRRRADARR